MQRESGVAQHDFQFAEGCGAGVRFPSFAMQWQQQWQNEQKTFSSHGKGATGIGKVNQSNRGV